MPNFSKLFQEEVRRLARKEVKTAVDALHRDSVSLRKSIASLRKRLESLERQSKRIVKETGVAAPPDEPAEQGIRARISTKTISMLRQRLDLTQAEFAKLVGVSGQSVYQWERKGGRLQLRNATKRAILEAKSMGKKEARRKIEGK